MGDLAEVFRKVSEDLSTGRLYSSTESVLAGIRAVEDVVAAASSLGELARVLRTGVGLMLKSRPTSAMLFNSVRRLVAAIEEAWEGGLDAVKDAVKKRGDELRKSIAEANSAVARIASHRISDGDVVLTNSYSTVVYRALREAWDSGKGIEVYVTESRPRSEGFILARKVAELGIPTTVLVDSAVRFLMKEVDLVLVSSEAVAANGAVINKVGTSEISLAAHEARKRVLALASTLKFSPETLVGELVELVEARPEDLVRGEVLEELKGVAVKAPLFDVTPPEYVDAIVTEKGLIAPQAVILVVREIYGWPPRVATVEDLVEALGRLEPG